VEKELKKGDCIQSLACIFPEGSDSQNTTKPRHIGIEPHIHDVLVPHAVHTKAIGKPVVAIDHFVGPLNRH